MPRTARRRSGGRANAAHSIWPAKASPRTRSSAATWCSIPNCTRRRIASTPSCACCRARRSRSANGFRCGCITPRPRSERACRLARRRTDPAGRVGRRPAGARPADRRRGPRSLRHPRRVGPAHDRRRPVHRSASAGPATARAERQAQRAALAIADPQAAFAALLAAPPFAWDLAIFARDRALSAAQTERLAEKLGLVLLQSGASKIAISPDRWRIFTSSLLEELAAYHAENPDLQGIGREKLRLLLQPRLPAPVFVIALQTGGPQRRIGSGRLLRPPGRRMRRA